MNAWVVLAGQIAIYSVFLYTFALLKPASRLLYLYVYVVMIHLVGGFLGSVYRIPLTDEITLSAGSVSYGALLMTAMVLVMLGHELRVVRHLVLLVIVNNAFKLAIFGSAAWALNSPGLVNPFETSPEVFNSSLRVVIVGGLLIIVELLLLMVVFDRLKRHVNSTVALSAMQVVAYIVVLALDGVLFPPLALAGPLPMDAVVGLIGPGVAGKVLLGLGYSLPLLVFLLLFRSRIPAFGSKPLRALHAFNLPPSSDLRSRLDERDRELAATEQRQRELAGVRDVLVAVDDDADVDEKLDALEAALDRGMGGWHAAGLVVLGPGGTLTTYGDRAGSLVTDSSDVTRRSDRPWIESRELGEVVCAPIRARGLVVAVAEVRTSDRDARQLLEVADALRLEIVSLFRRDALATRQQWKRRQPVVSIIRERALEARFQPVVRLADRDVVAFEGLTRFEPGISPEERFREAGELGLGPDLELLAVECLVEAAADLPAGRGLSLNLSPSSLFDPRLPAILEGADRTITLEVTEHDPVEDYRAVGRVVEGLPDVRLAVDDAGSGYASMQHIMQLHPDEVKLDIGWVTGVHADKARQGLIRGLVAFVEEIGAIVTAEGIEEAVDAEVLIDLGVARGQGYLFGHPARASSFQSA